MTIPSALRVPFVAVEIDNTRAGSGSSTLAYRALLIGQKLATGSAAANSLHRITNADQVIALAGAKSQLHRMAEAFFAGSKAIECWIGVLADDGAGVTATNTLTFTGPATAPGTLAVYIGGRAVRVGVDTGDTAANVAAALVAAIGSNFGVTAAVGGSGSEHVVTLTNRHKGAWGNELDVRLNYQQGESLPGGVGVTITAPTGGTSSPVLTSLIAALGDSWFHVIAHPYTDATSLSALETELASRFGPMRMIDGVALTAKHAAFGTVAALGETRNSPHSSILRTSGSPTPPDEYAAHTAAVVAVSASADPALPFQTLALPWILPPAEVDRDTLEERNQLLYDGIATTRVGPGEQVQIDRLITTYRQNAAGADDESYLDATTLFTLMLARYTFRNRIATRYPRHKLGRDGVRYPRGEAVITPAIGRAEAVAWFVAHSTTSPVIFDPGSLDQFKAGLLVEIDANNPNRLNFLLPPDLIGQLVVGAATLQFIR